MWADVAGSCSDSWKSAIRGNNNELGAFQHFSLLVLLDVVCIYFCLDWTGADVSGRLRPPPSADSHRSETMAGGLKTGWSADWTNHFVCWHSITATPLWFHVITHAELCCWLCVTCVCPDRTKTLFSHPGCVQEFSKLQNSIIIIINNNNKNENTQNNLELFRQ